MQNGNFWKLWKCFGKIKDPLVQAALPSATPSNTLFVTKAIPRTKIDTAFIIIRLSRAVDEYSSHARARRDKPCTGPKTRAYKEKLQHWIILTPGFFAPVKCRVCKDRVCVPVRLSPFRRLVMAVIYSRCASSTSLQSTGPRRVINDLTLRARSLQRIKVQLEDWAQQQQ